MFEIAGENIVTGATVWCSKYYRIGKQLEECDKKGALWCYNSNYKKPKLK